MLLPRVLSLLLTMVLIVGISALLRTPQKAKSKTVVLNKVLLIIGLIGTTAFLIPAFITAFLCKSIAIPLIFVVLSTLSASLVIAYLNCRIWYDDRGFTAKSFLGIKQSYSYNEISGIMRNMNSYVLFIGKRRISINRNSIGNTDFISIAKKNYKKEKQEPIPEIYKTKHDLYNGNIYSSGEFIFIYILMFVFLISFLVFVLFYVFANPMHDVTTIDTTFSSCSMCGSDAVLVSVSDKEYIIRSVPKKYDISVIESVCDGKSEVTVQTEQYTSKDNKPCTEVWSIHSGDKVILSESDTKAFYRAEFMPVLLFPLGFLLVWSFFFFGSIIVGRNPKKHRKIVHWFFKPGYVNWNNRPD